MTDGGRAARHVSRETPEAPAARLLARCRAMGVSLEASSATTLISLVEALLFEPQNLTGIATVTEAIDRHLADSLSALTVPEMAAASTFLDLGSGPGFPGMALAVARSDLDVTLVEAEERKAGWLRRASGPFPNVRVVAERSETLAARERERWDSVGIRAVAPTEVALELAAPLVAVGGHAALWRGADSEAQTRAGDRAAAALGFGPGQAHPTRPFPGSRRHIRIFVKRDATDSRFPRRPGRAAKRPLA